MEKKLLNLLLSLHTLEPNFTNWTHENFEDNPPRLLRLQMIEAYFLAYDLGSDFKSFSEGVFLQETSPLLWELMQVKIKGSSPMIDKLLTSKEVDMQYSYFFKFLFSYRLLVEGVLEKGSTVYAASGMYLIALALHVDLNKKIRREVQLIDELLAILLNPNQVVITKRKLIKEFGCPNVDLESIDIDWM